MSEQKTSFFSSENREWKVPPLNAAALLRWRASENIQIDPLDHDNVIPMIMNDPIEVAAIMAKILEPKFPEAKITETIFLNRMEGDACRQASEVLLERYIDFFTCPLISQKLALLVAQEREKQNSDLPPLKNSGT